MDVNFSCEGIANCSFVNSDLLEGDVVWNGRSVSLKNRTGDSVIQLMGKRGEGSLSAGYSEKDGFYVDGKFVWELGGSDDKNSDRAGEPKDSSDSTERPDSSDRASDKDPG